MYNIKFCYRFPLYYDTDSLWVLMNPVAAAGTTRTTTETAVGEFKLLPVADQRG